jgi:predicted phosphatase
MIIIRVSLLLKVETEDDELYMWSDDSEWFNLGEERRRRILERKVKQSKGGWVNAHTHTNTTITWMKKVFLCCVGVIEWNVVKVGMENGCGVYI